MTGGCRSAPITGASLLVPPLSQQLKVLIFFVTTAIMRYAASHVPIILSIHIYLGACSEPASPTVPVTL